ncbi:EcsC family protein [uncultured Metabacillus sp.]|uniref:EcsC family protein n=1 Tax=uncultured Metabacillus sp. TaxID=2860135 RepID=UPI002627CA85|nr:EcsC family protein [uncultured Metabacillus sp.]
MIDSIRERAILDEIMLWESELQNDLRTDFQRTFDRWMNHKLNEIPDSMKRLFFKKLDASLFHLHSFIQSSFVQQDAKKQILLSAKALNEDIIDFSDLHKLPIDQLHYLADLQTSKHRLYSFLQGGITGTGGLLLTGIDIPVQTILNLRSIQMVSMCYGYEISNPYEMMTSLKVYHASLMPKHLQYKAWLDLKEELTSDNMMSYFYEGNDDLVNSQSLEFLLKQIAKLSVISLFKRRLVAGLPLISIMIGAGANYQLTRQVTDFANKFYQYRLISEKNIAGGLYDE